MKDPKPHRDMYFVRVTEHGVDGWFFESTTERGIKIILTRERRLPGRVVTAYQLLDSERPARNPDGTPSKNAYIGCEYPDPESIANIPAEIALQAFEPKPKPKRGRPPIPEEDKVGKRKRITLYLTDEQHGKLKALAEADGVSVQAFSIGKLFYNRLWE